MFVANQRRAVSFQQIPAAIVFQNLHLLNGYLVEFYEAFALRHTVVDEHGIDILHVREADELVYDGIVSNVAFLFRIRSWANLLAF